MLRWWRPDRRDWWGGSLAVRLALASLLGVSSVHAESTADTPTATLPTANGGASSLDESKRAEAQERFQRGLALAKGQRWDAALAEFLTSRELFPTRSATRNAAVALQRLGRYVEAYETYTSLLEEFRGSIPPDQLELVSTEMAETLKQTAEIAVATLEPGVAVAVDGRPRGTTPMAATIRVDPGTHVVRLSKAGFQVEETRVTVASGTRRTVDSRLKALQNVGTLVVREASGAHLQVLVDATVVGTTPWVGAMPPGQHAVLLRGPGNFGTAPSSATVRASSTVTLVLRAVELNATVRLDPTPSNATLFVDGVPVGAGVWDGLLSSGPHRFEATAPGHLPFRQVIALEPRQERLIPVVLERDASTWQLMRRRRFYLEATVGPMFARSLGGGADQACDCSERSRPLGGAAQFRGGLELTRSLGLELGVGYLLFRESMTRRLEAAGESNSPTWSSSNYEDTTRLAGPSAALGVAYRALAAIPTTARIVTGVALLRSSTTNRGTFDGVFIDPGSGGEPTSLQRQVEIEERGELLGTPFLTTELRAGYAITKHLSVDVGVGLMAFFPPRISRTSTSDLGGARRGVALADEPSPGEPLRPGVLLLPDEKIAGPFLALAPSLGLSFSF